MSTVTDEQKMRDEIARLKASINQHKSRPAPAPSRYGGYPAARPNTYMNPTYRQPANRYDPRNTAYSVGLTSAASSSAPKEVVLGGVAFESSRRSLVRKDLPKPSSIQRPSTSLKASSVPSSQFKKVGHRNPGSYSYKVKTRGHRGRNVAQRGRSFGRGEAKRTRYINKPCPRFSTTGACSRALTCQYQHDPDKIAICWNFLQGDCPNSAETCNLSHDPTPERTPLCLHFLNNGRCTRSNCPFPHVNVGARTGICRDFAVLGYCEQGLNCDKQHIRECPDFAETGDCTQKGCKLPHVIRANRNRKAAISAVSDAASSSGMVDSSGSNANTPPAQRTLMQAQLGDEFISLTFNESDDEESASDESQEEDDDEENPGEENNDDDDIDDSHDLNLNGRDDVQMQ